MDEPPSTCETSEIMNKLDMGEIPETPAKEQGYGPLDAANCSLSAAESALIGIAAEMLRPGVFLSDFAEDHPKRTPKWVIKAAERQRDQLQRWATKIASSARSLRKANAELRDRSGSGTPIQDQPSKLP